LPHLRSQQNRCVVPAILLFLNYVLMRDIFVSECCAIEGYFCVRVLCHLLYASRNIPDRDIFLSEVYCGWMVVLGSVWNAKRFENVIFCNWPTEDQSVMFIMSRNCATECSLCLTFVEEVHQILVYSSKGKYVQIWWVIG